MSLSISGVSRRDKKGYHVIYKQLRMGFLSVLMFNMGNMELAHRVLGYLS